MSSEVEWAKWVVMHHVLGYAPLTTTEIEVAFGVLKREQEKKDETQPMQSAGDLKHIPMDGSEI